MGSGHLSDSYLLKIRILLKWISNAPRPGKYTDFLVTLSMNLLSLFYFRSGV